MIMEVEQKKLLQDGERLCSMEKMTRSTKTVVMTSLKQGENDVLDHADAVKAKHT